MKVFYSNILPFKGFRAINLFGIIFARKDLPKLTKEIINHETIHTRQMLELFIVLFYVWYLTEWLIKLVIYKDSLKAYENISFEREAFANDENLHYLDGRRWFAFLRYL